MRVALISDIHGNLVALETVLADIRRQHVDMIVCLGDVAATGPRPREVLECIQDLGCPVVLGNADAHLLNLQDETSDWCRRQLLPRHLDFLRTFRPTVEVRLGPGTTLLCFHGSPRSYNDILMATTPIEEVATMIRGCRAAILAGGHTHVQMIRRHIDVMIINPGSVGLPYDKNPWTGEVPQDEVRLAPWSEYAVVRYEEGRLGVEMCRVPLDVAAVRRQALHTDWPQAREWAESWRT